MDNLLFSGLQPAPSRRRREQGGGEQKPPAPAPVPDIKEPAPVVPVHE